MQVAVRIIFSIGLCGWRSGAGASPLMWIEGVGHLSNMEAPERFQDVVALFLIRANS
jgi:pimeloyl-ACP methyl ester carboxylesterase